MALTDHFRTRCRADLEGRYRHIFQQHAGLSANGVGVEPGDFVAGRRIAHGVTGQDSQPVAAHAGKCPAGLPAGRSRPWGRTGQKLEQYRRGVAGHRNIRGFNLYRLFKRPGQESAQSVRLCGLKSRKHMR